MVKLDEEKRNMRNPKTNPKCKNKKWTVKIDARSTKQRRKKVAKNLKTGMKVGSNGHIR